MKRPRYLTAVSFAALGFVLAGCGGQTETADSESETGTTKVKAVEPVQIYKWMSGGNAYLLCVEGQKYLVVMGDNATTTRLDGSTC